MSEQETLKTSNGAGEIQQGNDALTETQETPKEEDTKQTQTETNTEEQQKQTTEEDIDAVINEIDSQLNDTISSFNPAMEPQQSQQPQFNNPQQFNQQPQAQSSPEEIISKTAMEVFKQKYGEEYNPFDPTHQAKYSAIASFITQQYLAEQQKIQQQMVVKQRIAQKINEVAQTEPNFMAIDKYAMEKLYSLPYAKASKILSIVNRVKSGVATDSELGLLEKYWKACAKEWYAKNSKPQETKTPPYSQTAGNTPTQTQANTQTPPVGFDNMVDWLKNSDLLE